MGNCKSTVSIPGDKPVGHNQCSNASSTSDSHTTEDAIDPVTVIRNKHHRITTKDIDTIWNPTHCVCQLYTVSGRDLKNMEDFLTTSVYPFYSNTHTEASATGAITTHFREEALQIISKSLNAPPEKYAVLFSWYWLHWCNSKDDEGPRNLSSRPFHHNMERL